MTKTLKALEDELYDLAGEIARTEACVAHWTNAPREVRDTEALARALRRRGTLGMQQTRVMKALDGTVQELWRHGWHVEGCQTCGRACTTLHVHPGSSLTAAARVCHECHREKEIEHERKETLALEASPLGSKEITQVRQDWRLWRKEPARPRSPEARSTPATPSGEGARGGS